MLRIECNACHACHRLDERVLPDTTPTFKCSECGLEFTADSSTAQAENSAVSRPAPWESPTPYLEPEPTTPNAQTAYRVANDYVPSATPVNGDRSARPTSPTMLVALPHVRPEYVTIRNGPISLLVSGNAENLGSAPLQEILIAVDLLDRRGRNLANGAFYCGNGLTARKVNEMTPREIDSVQRLVPPRNFAINGYQRAPFNMVFMSPPAGITHLRIAVAKAVMQKNAQPQ